MNIEQPDELRRYLIDRGHLASDATARIERIDGGVSNRTMRVRFDDGTGWVLKQALAKLRVEVDWFSDPARIVREALGMRRLGELLPAGTVPRLLFEDPAEHLLAMTEVPEPHANWKQVLLAETPERNHVHQSAELLGTLHARALDRAAELKTEFADVSFFESLRLEPYYEYTAERVLEAAAFLTQLLVDTRQQRRTLVHGDYSPKNILIHAGRLVLLDHEVIHWGDPAFDVGFFLAHLLSKAHHCRDRRDAFLDAVVEWWNEYVRHTASVEPRRSLEARCVRHTLACLLARVRGRSTLEYLDEQERSRQTQIVVRLMTEAPSTIDELVHRWQELLGNSP